MEIHKLESHCILTGKSWGIIANTPWGKGPKELFKQVLKFHPQNTKGYAIIIYIHIVIKSNPNTHDSDSVLEVIT